VNFRADVAASVGVAVRREVATMRERLATAIGTTPA
jgi:hypothetical protein